MTRIDRRAMERRVRVALKIAKEKIDLALERFKEVDCQEVHENVEDMDFIIDCWDDINKRNTFYYEHLGKNVQRDAADLMSELQDAYCDEALKYYGEEDNYEKLSDMVAHIKELNSEAEECNV